MITNQLNRAYPNSQSTSTISTHNSRSSTTIPSTGARRVDGD